MDNRELTGYPSLEERRRHRRELRRRLRRRSLILAGAAVFAITAAILFSPIGPFGYIVFPGSGSTPPENGAGRANGAAPDAPPQPEPEAPSPAGRAGEASDPTAPTIAIVVDDTGPSADHLGEWLAIDAPITFSALPYCAATPDVVERLHAAGFRIMLHIPTENDPPNSFSGLGQLTVDMDRATVFSTLDGDLEQVPHAAGINNHQGGRGCNDLALMTYECEWAAERGLYVVDSDSSTHSQVTAAMAGLGMARRKNQFFIDHDNDPDYIRSALRRMADLARREGVAIGICHFGRPNTARTVGEMVKTLEAEGIRFAFVQDVHN